MSAVVLFDSLGISRATFLHCPTSTFLVHLNIFFCSGPFPLFCVLQYRDAKGVILLDILRQGQCINTARYCSTLDRLKEAIRRKRPGLLRRGVDAFTFLCDRTSSFL
ncbi:mariner mos1 transposase-like protein [Plakobranchus ocellatus]|uniref:Mariner mos1 transposase-like protein n=1 Tax=Plakobranchus ocellatus TaxID=259542 RepID=A0AAV4CCQ9_9GAST|nr:mariner mos1 transposase-like protein [Plakobranchus ocellatus]